MQLDSIHHVLSLAGSVLLYLLMLGAAGMPGLTHAQAPAEVEQAYSTFEVHFDSTTTTRTSQGTFQSRVEGRILISETDATHYQGFGRLAYRSFSGPGSYSLLDGILRVFDATIPANQGAITMYLFPGNPKPHEYTAVPQVGTFEYYFWFGAFGALHMDEFGEQGYEITGWEFPTGGDVYAQKEYNRTETIGNGTYSENTRIELIGRPPAPTITQITSKGIGTASENPETGSEVLLEADLENTDGYDVTKCSWTGDLPQPETTTPISNSQCRLRYTPNTGPGPERATYGPKDVTLTITYEHPESGATGQDQKTHSYKVFFPKFGDDDSDGTPNWFEYWGDDGAVPGLDAPDVVFDENIDSLGGYHRTDDVIYIGTGAAERVKPRSAPATDSCPGFSHPSAEGIDAAAVTIVHEGKHKKLEHKRRGDWASLTDTDGDGVPDSVEATTGTDPSNPDSCNLGQSIHSSYADDGDDEFIARTVHDEAVAVPENDWANPGKQTDPPYLATGTQARKAAPAARDSVASWASLTGGYGDSTADTDGDGSYDTLTISAGVTVTTEASYNLVMTLTDGAGTDIATASSVETLTPGAHTVNLPFDGQTIRQAGFDGPYHVERVELRAPTEFREVLTDAGDDVHDTAGYRATDFDRPAAIFTGGVNDTATDTNGDGLYDELRITADLDVQPAGTYTVTGELEDTTLGLVASTSTAIGTGANTVTLAFDGRSIFHYREDGPYTVRRLRVTDDTGEVLDVAINAHTTAAYDHTQFQHGGTTIDTSTYSDTAIDANGDGKYDELRIEFRVASEAAGPYRALATLASDDGAAIATAGDAIGLTGSISATLVNTITLGFDGTSIEAAGVDGLYTVTSVAIIAEDGGIADFHPVAHTTQAYEATDFAALRRVFLPVIIR